MTRLPLLIVLLAGCSSAQFDTFSSHDDQEESVSDKRISDLSSRALVGFNNNLGGFGSSSILRTPQIVTSQNIPADLFGNYAFNYSAPDGTLVEVAYVADENGFRPKSPVIPQTPAHALAQIKAAEEAKRSGVLYDQQGNFFRPNRFYDLGLLQGGLTNPGFGFRNDVIGLNQNLPVLPSRPFIGTGGLLGNAAFTNPYVSNPALFGSLNGFPTTNANLLGLTANYPLGLANLQGVNPTIPLAAGGFGVNPNLSLGIGGLQGINPSLPFGSAVDTLSLGGNLLGSSTNDHFVGINPPPTTSNDRFGLEHVKDEQDETKTANERNPERPNKRRFNKQRDEELY